MLNFHIARFVYVITILAAVVPLAKSGPWDMDELCMCDFWCFCWVEDEEPASKIWPPAFGPFNPGDARDLFVCQADLTEPYGVLDLQDLVEFLAFFNNNQPAADLAHPAGVYDSADLNFFLTVFEQGCIAPELFVLQDFWAAAGSAFDTESSVIVMSPDDKSGVRSITLVSADAASGDIMVDGTGSIEIFESHLIEDISSVIHEYSDVINPGDQLTIETFVYSISGQIQIGFESWIIVGHQIKFVIVESSGQVSSKHEFSLFSPLHEVPSVTLAIQMSQMYALADPYSRSIQLESETRSQCAADFALCRQSAYIRFQTSVKNCGDNWLSSCLGGGITGGFVGGGVCSLIPGAGTAACAAGGAILGCGGAILLHMKQCTSSAKRTYWSEVHICHLQYQRCIGVNGCNVGCP